MKRRNILRFRRALTLLSVAAMMLSQGVPAYAGVAEAAESETAQEQVTTQETSESVSESAPAEEESSSSEVVEVTVDKSELTQLYQKLSQVIANEQTYTPVSFEAVRSAQVTAEAVLNDAAATNEQVSGAVAAINNALAGLVLRADKSQLQQWITKAASYQAQDYTKESFAVLQNSLTKARTVSENPNASVEEVAQSVAELQNAINQLKKAEQPKPEQPEQKPDPKPETSKPETEKPKPSEPKPEKNESKPAASKEEKPADSTGTQTSRPVVQGPVSDESTPLDDNLVTDSLTDSDLNGFELPLLSSYSDKRQAAIVSESLKQLSLPYEEGAKGPEAFDNLHLPNYIYQKVFGHELGDTYEEMAKAGEKRTLEEAEPGDLLFWEKDGKADEVAVYLGAGKYLLADESALEEVQQTIEDDEKEEIPGVRIFSLQGYDLETGEISEEDTEEFSLSEERKNPEYAVHVMKDWDLTEYGKELIDTYAASMDFRVNKVTERFIEKIAKDAQELGLKYDVFASVMIAQAILESGSGQSTLSMMPHFNLFGIKGSFRGGFVTMPTFEDRGNGELYQINAAFRNYPNYKESLTDYVRLIRGGISGNPNFYKGVWRSEAKNYLQATQELTGKYATDTSYNNKLNSLIAVYNLTRFDEPTSEATGMIIQSRSEIPAYYRNKMTFPVYNGRNYNTSGSYPVGQCTWYVYNRIRQLGGFVDDFMGNGGEWGQKGARLGYRTSRQPRKGYAVSFHPGVAGSSPIYGHVAFVEAVGPDGILVSEGNVVGPTTVSYRVIPNSIARSNNVTYIAPK